MTEDRYLTVDKMPRLEMVLPDSDGVMHVAPAGDLVSTADAISVIASRRRRRGHEPTGFYLSPQRFLALRMELVPQHRAMHVQPLHDPEGLMVKAAISIKNVPVFEDDTRLDDTVCWTEVAA